MFKRFVSSTISLGVISSLLLGSAFADAKVSRESVDFEDFDVQMASFQEATVATENCDFDLPAEQYYEGSVISVRKKLQFDNGEVFRTKVFLLNEGNMTWFSKKSACLGPKMSLGTEKERDRVSELYESDLDGWDGPNRIFMDQFRVDPGEIASFTFYSKAPKKDDVLKEYFAPVLDGIQWLEDETFSMEVVSGELDEDPVDMRRKVLYKGLSGSVNDVDLSAKREILVDLNKQQLYLILGGKILRQFTISSGAYDTPTPVGEYKISLKQKVRVGMKAPHYIMPNFMWFRAGGYGFHALPSLKTDGGKFWTEARSHIGRPVSHGCVRVLPEDSDFLFDFTTIGTTRVSIKRNQDKHVAGLERL